MKILERDLKIRMVLRMSINEELDTLEVKNKFGRILNCCMNCKVI